MRRLLLVLLLVLVGPAAWAPGVSAAVWGEAVSSAAVSSSAVSSGAVSSGAVSSGAVSSGAVLVAAAPPGAAPSPGPVPSPSASPAPRSSPPPASLARAGVVVVGVAGLRWDDVGPQTPALLALARTGAVGALSVKARPATSCPSDGWLTLGAGTRADAFDPRALPCGDGLGAGPDAGARNLDTPDGAVLGALAEALGGRFEAVGDGARLAMGGGGRAEQPVVVVDPAGAEVLDRAAAAQAADAAVASALQRLPAGADLLVVGLSEAVGEAEPRLHVAMATGPSFPRGALRSASTRRAPYVQLIDVAPTVLDAAGEPLPEVMDGQPWQVVGPAPTVAELVDLDRRATGQRAATVPFFVVLLAVPLALLVVLWRRSRAAELVALAATAALGASYLANLVPWWRADVPLLGLLAVVVLLAVAVASLALLLTGRPPAGLTEPTGPPAPRGSRPSSAAIFAPLRSTRRRGPQDGVDHRAAAGAVSAPARLVCGFVAAVVAVDLVTGAHLQMSSVAGYSPLVAGRFAGIGNVAFGVLAAAVLLAVSGSRRAVVIAAVGLVAVVVDGAPAFGSDVGGVLALVPAFVVLALLRTGTRVTVGRLLLAGGGAVALVTAFAVLDWSRPEQDRTHLGRFVQDVVDGTAGELLSRKAAAVLDLLFRSPVTALLPVAVAAVVYLVLRPPAQLAAAFARAPSWRHGLAAVGVASLLGFALNDSGAAVPALAICVALPATAAVVARVRRG